MPSPAPTPRTPPPAASLPIGALARSSGRSVHTIRWYEAQGLMPGVQRDSGGRRRYSPQHIEWLDLMVRLRATGMTIAKMRRYATLVRQGKASLGERQALLQSHRDEVLARIAEWNSALTLLDDKIDFYGEWLHTGKRPRWPNESTPQPRSTKR
ncbi:MAG: MerR family transcriptional regulator [Burkholderiales bacterium]|nr:MerR family transcriptional regulator [Burkholderiales bacterium]